MCGQVFQTNVQDLLELLVARGQGEVRLARLLQLGRQLRQLPLILIVILLELRPTVPKLSTDLDIFGTSTTINPRRIGTRHQGIKAQRKLQMGSHEWDSPCPAEPCTVP